MPAKKTQTKRTSAKPAPQLSPRDLALVRRISARFPSPEGWSYDAANGTIDQVATFGAPGWAPTAGL